MRILVVGGAGYIGSHVVRWLDANGHEAWVFDNLDLGHREAVLRPERFLEGDLDDRASLARAFATQPFDAVMHFAAFASVPESVGDPAKYYRNNVIGTLNLLDAMRDASVGRIVFSSTCAVYGIPEIIPIHEDTPTQPVNPYGFSKLAIERALSDYAAAYGMSAAALRYFNAAGASGDAVIGEDHTPETHLIPLVLQVALGQRQHITIYGTDYPTPDGTCIRDYIHVEDLADAHERVLHRLEPGKLLIYNLGTGRGASVREIIEASRRVTGHSIPTTEADRRPGDPPELVARPDKAQRELEWTPRFTDIEATIASAWKWHRSHPEGYRSR